MSKSLSVSVSLGPCWKCSNCFDTCIRLDSVKCFKYVDIILHMFTYSASTVNSTQLPTQSPPQPGSLNDPYILLASSISPVCCGTLSFFRDSPPSIHRSLLSSNILTLVCGIPPRPSRTLGVIDESALPPS